LATLTRPSYLTSISAISLLGALVGIGLLLMLGSATSAQAALLPPSDYVARPVCHSPAPGRAGCLALRLEAKTAPLRARIQALAARPSPQAPLAKASQCAALYASSCLTPQNLRQAYFPGETPDAPASVPQTIALVDAYNDLNAEADLDTYSSEFGLPPCTRENGCFTKVGENGSESALPFPASKSELEAFAGGTRHRREKAEEAEGWALETDTDIEVAHAICQNCHIVLVEASGPEYGELETAENAAVALHASEISNSWGGPESAGDSSAFNHPGIVIAAASGDDGYLNWDQYATRNEPGSPYFEGVDYPASSPHVVSVGGTKLELNAEGAWAGESPWDAASSNEGAGGSGCSGSLQAPSWQSEVADWAQVGCGSYRANADVSADADPSTGVNVYDSTPYPEEGKTVVPNWVPIGGTSVATPMVTAMFALAGGAHGVAYPAETLYTHLGEATLHDVSSGGNGACDDNYASCEGSLVSPLDCGPDAWICNATVGYDGPTGVGTPNGLAAFTPAASTTAKGGEGEVQTTAPEETGQTQGGGSGAGGGKAGEGPIAQPLGGASSGSASKTSGGAPGQGATTQGSATGAPARILALALTANARAAVRLGALRISRLAFSLRTSRASVVNVTLSIRVGGSRARWRKLGYSFGFAAAKGLNGRRLRGGRTLAPGLYRVAFTPAGGSARSLVFRVP
jgi:Subtilase family